MSEDSEILLWQASSRNPISQLKLRAVHTSMAELDYKPNEPWKEVGLRPGDRLVIVVGSHSIEFRWKKAEKK